MKYPANIQVTQNVDAEGVPRTSMHVIMAATQTNIFTGQPETVLSAPLEYSDATAADFKAVLGEAATTALANAIKLQMAVDTVTTERNALAQQLATANASVDELTPRVANLVQSLADATAAGMEKDASIAALESQMTTVINEANTKITSAEQLASEQVANAERDAAGKIQAAQNDAAEARASVATMQSTLAKATAGERQVQAENSNLRVQNDGIREQRDMANARITRLVQQVIALGAVPVGENMQAAIDAPVINPVTGVEGSTQATDTPAQDAEEA